MPHAGSGRVTPRRSRAWLRNAFWPCLAAALLAACAEVGPRRPAAAEAAPDAGRAARAESAAAARDAPPPRAAPVPPPPSVAAPPVAAGPAPRASAKAAAPRTKAIKRAAKPNGGSRETATGTAGAAGSRAPARGAGGGFASAGRIGALAAGNGGAPPAPPRPVEAVPERAPEAASPPPAAAPAAPAAAPPPVEPVTAPTFAAAAAYHVPTPMTVGQAETVRLWLDKRATAQALLARLRERVGGEAGVLRAEEVPATPRMRATLTGDKFEIRPLFDEVQTVYENKDTRWEWEVVPKEAGTHELRVHLRMVLAGSEDSLDSRVWPVEVVAKPLTPWQQFKAWLKEAQEVDAMIKGIFGIGIAGAIVWLWARLRRRGGRPAAGDAGGS